MCARIRNWVENSNQKVLRILVICVMSWEWNVANAKFPKIRNIHETLHVFMGYFDTDVLKCLVSLLTFFEVMHRCIVQ
ncbi:unnamed protein product [Cylicocyclus nassatus]|uniref:Uncharacterized protein n=1 Tax=Cylicocyclus nassatus TaxID=53992 RepID=A0AA36DTZ9_CYLNA|nr:unnamed protein product [Cylicocyclus nassatus]